MDGEISPSGTLGSQNTQTATAFDWMQPLFADNFLPSSFNFQNEGCLREDADWPIRSWMKCALCMASFSVGSDRKGLKLLSGLLFFCLVPYEGNFPLLPAIVTKQEMKESLSTIKGNPL